MKTLFSIIRHVGLALSVIFCFPLSGCTEEKPLPSMVFDYPEISTSAEASALEIHVRLENFPDEYELKFSCPDEWVWGFKESEKGIISFNTDANEAEEPRETEVTVTADGLECHGSFTVLQAGKDMEEPDEPDDPDEPVDPDAPVFEIIIDGVSSSTVSYSIVPRDKEMTYMVMVAERLYFDSFESDEAFFNDCLDLFRDYAAEYGMDFYDYLMKHVLQSGDDMDNEMFVMETKTVRYVCANGIDESGTMTTPVYKEPFAEGYEGFKEMDFDIQCDVDGVEVEMTVVPSDDGRRYYVDAVEKSIVDYYGIETYMQEKINQLIAIGEIFGETADEIIAERVSYGRQVFSFSMEKSSTEYVGCAFSVEPYGIINSNIVTKEFETGEIQGSDNVISIEMSAVNVNSAHYKATTSNDDGYLIFFEPASSFEGMDDSEIISRLIESKPNIDYYVIYGDTEDDVKGLDADTEYLALAFGYKGGEATTELFKTGFRTLSSSDSEGMTFEISVSNITKFSADVTIVADPETALYYWKEALADASEEEIRASIDEAVEQEIWSGFFDTRAEYFLEYGTRGSFTKYKDLYPGTKYKIFAVGISEETGDYTTEFYYSEQFETPPVY